MIFAAFFPNIEPLERSGSDYIDVSYLLGVVVFLYVVAPDCQIISCYIKVILSRCHR